MSCLTLEDRAAGCLLGGALGDALGWPVEFMSWSAIRETYGPDGIRDLDQTEGHITDDTQMTLFSAEGIIRAKVRWNDRGLCHAPSVVGYAYQRWLHTQGEPCLPLAIEPDVQGWLVKERGLHFRRAPGMTCLSALRKWNLEPADNDSKGCGSVMRSAPFGFCPSPASTAAECSQITHGHPEATAASALMAVTIAGLSAGAGLSEAVHAAMREVEGPSRSHDLLLRALELAAEGADPQEAFAELGEGWVAEEALAIGAFAAARHEHDFRAAVRVAVNHSGDSDSTGSICGNLLGARHGLAGLPEDWLERLELREVIEQVARDLVTNIPRDGPEGESFAERYPGC